MLCSSRIRDRWSAGESFVGQERFLRTSEMSCTGVNEMPRLVDRHFEMSWRNSRAQFHYRVAKCFCACTSMRLLPTHMRELSEPDQMIRTFSSNAPGVCSRSRPEESMESLDSRRC